MRKGLIVVAAMGVLTTLAYAGDARSVGDSKCIALRDAYLAGFKPLWLEAQASWWEASITGTDAAFARRKAADQALVELHHDAETFAQIKALKEQGQVSDPVLRRQLDEMYRAFLPGQADPAVQKRIVELESDVEQIFNTHRSKVGGDTLTENQVRRILANTSDSAKARAAWNGYMEVGRKGEAKLRELVGLRNRQAVQLGFASYYSMSLVLQEIDEKDFFELFDELDALTRGPFAALKPQIDSARAARFGVPVEQLRPWHYGDLFFQEAPGGQEINLDDLFAGRDLAALSERYYAGLDLPCRDILARSDLYEKPGKSPHAFCSDQDRAGDVRVLCNIEPNLYWAETMLHELGHAVYDKHIRPDVPFLLRRASHAITTEGIAILFGAMAKNEQWLARYLQLDPAQAGRVGRAARDAQRSGKLIFSRWAQVMVRFEHGMYTNPDQDLGKLWWDLKKRYQLLNPPETVDRPDYAAKMHVLNYPVYYHSYLMGEMFAAQVRHYIGRQVLGLDDPGRSSFAGQPKVGRYLRERIFGFGNLYSWNELTKRATGEPLTAKYLVADIVR